MASAGPLGALLAYALVGTVAYAYVPLLVPLVFGGIYFFLKQIIVRCWRDVNLGTNLGDVPTFWYQFLYSVATSGNFDTREF